LPTKRRLARLLLLRYDDGCVHPFLPGFQRPVAIVTTPDAAVLVGDWGSGTDYRIAPA
jgi:hypothetical protein